MDVFKDRISNIAESKYKELLVILSNRRTVETAISRYELVVKLKMSDRDVRELITKARKSRFPIVINHNEGGYYLTDRIDEIETFRNRELHSRIGDLRETDEGMLGAIEYLKGTNPEQITIDDIII